MNLTIIGVTRVETLGFVARVGHDMSNMQLQYAKVPMHTGPSFPDNSISPLRSVALSPYALYASLYLQNEEVF